MNRSRRSPPVERRYPALGVAACGLLAACTAIGPDYRPPEVQVPGQWRPPAAVPSTVPALPSPPAAALPPAGPVELLDTAWWAAFGDPQLDALIRLALEENKDLRIAALRVEQYNSQLQVAQAEGGPQAVARAQRSRDAVSQNRFIPLVAGAYPVGNVYEIGAGVTWEIDFWGRVRRANESALADLMATEEDRRALTLSLVANVASAYVTLLGLDRELELYRLSAASRQESMQLLAKKLEGGGVGEQPYFMARAEYEEALAELTMRDAEITVLEHSLSSLLGRGPGRIDRGKPLAALNLPPIPAGLPADLLVQRPDIRKAEQELISANARIGIAKAQYLPTIGLTAQYGFASDELNKLLQSSSNVSSFGVTLLGPIFTSGRTAGQVREAEAIQQQKAMAYLLSVQAALREVEDALVLHRQTWQRSAIRSRQLEALRAHGKSALKRYEGGRSSYLEVLDADRSTLAGEIQQNQTRRDQYIALISVYKAMGGGWSIEDSPLAAPTAKANTP
jgi:multidrug efflux system outer membrane protein